MGVVYAAYDDELGREVAIKVLRGRDGRGAEGAARLVREAQAMAKLSHPNVGHVYEVGTEGEQTFIVMELVPGQTLRHWAQTRERSWREIVDIHIAVGQGLAAAHAAGLVHRDYKPDNVLVDTVGRPRVVDFGLALPDGELGRLPSEPNPGDSTVGGSDRITKPGRILGTPAYMAPEQCVGGLVDARADQFAFCVGLYECLYGHRPFEGATPADLALSIGRQSVRSVSRREYGVPSRLHAAVLRGLKALPADRFATLDELLGQLRTVSQARARRRWSVPIAMASAVSLATLAMSNQSSLPVPGVQTADAAPRPDRLERWAAIVDASGLPEPTREPRASDPAEVTVHRLLNGLTVYVAPKPGEPSIEVRVAVRGGPAQERESEPGVSGLVLAALIAGSDRLGTVDFEAERPMLARQHRLIEVLGGIENATARDELISRLQVVERTAPYSNAAEPLAVWRELGVRDFRAAEGASGMMLANVPRNRLRSALALLSDTLRRSVFREFAGVCAHELAHAEYLAHLDHAAMLEARELRTALGWGSDPEANGAFIRTLPLVAAKRFYSTFYRPNNVALILVGDVSSDEVLPVLEKMFGDWEPAALPRRRSVYRTLGTRRVVDTIDGASSMLSVTWPLPPPGDETHPPYYALGSAMVGPDGLLASALALRSRENELEVTFSERKLKLRIWPLPGESLNDVEAVLLTGLRTIAQDELPGAVWDGAWAEQERRAMVAVGESSTLATMLARSFNDGVSWQSMLEQRASREELVAAAGALLDQGHLVVRQEQGHSYVFPIEPLPGGEVPPTDKPGHGEFARALLDAEVTAIEPLFIAPGRHFDRTAHGAGQLITVETSGPTFHLEFAYPVGARRDPWLCEALRARAPLRRDVPGLRGVEVYSSCTASETTVHATGVARRLDEVLPALLRFVATRSLGRDAIREHVTRTMAAREQMRADPEATAEALHEWALLDGQSMQGLLPSDDALRRRAQQEIPRALQEVGEIDPDILYVGPEGDALRRGLPAPRGGARPDPAAPMLRRLEEPTVFLIEDDELDEADLRIALPAKLAADGDLLPHLWERIMRAQVPKKRLWGEFDLGSVNETWTGGQRVFALGFRPPSDRAAEVIIAGLARLRSVATGHDFETARAGLEGELRASRVPQQDIARYVRGWDSRGATRDPRLAEWLGLAEVSFDEYRDYVAEPDGAAPIISMVADPRRVDLTELRNYGRVIVVDVEDVVRDVAFEDARAFRLWEQDVE